jgi:pimeloyl-ACP methyl ester carboxylesterase
MPAVFTDASWWNELVDYLNRDDEWNTAARYFTATVTLASPNSTHTLNIVNGTITSAGHHVPLTGADITIAAPENEWDRVVAGETDWFEGTSPGLGHIAVEGNAVLAMRNVKPMWLLLGAMAKVRRSSQPVSYSPDPVDSGREPVGKYVTVDGIRTYYEECGQGPTIYCIHAAGQDTLMYRHVLTQLSDNFRVISIDAPGHGKTLEPAGGAFTDITQHAQYHENVMAALDVDRPVLVGCSMGGNMVLELGARRPSHYRGIVSSEGSDYTPTVSSFLLEMLLLNSPQILECWSRSMTGNRTPPDRAREVVWQLRRVTPETINADLTGYAGFDRRDEVSYIECPVLLLRGDADWLVHQQMVEATASRMGGATVVVLEGTGHYPMIENPVEFCDAVRSFAAPLN